MKVEVKADVTIKEGEKETPAPKRRISNREHMQILSGINEFIEYSKNSAIQLENGEVIDVKASTSMPSEYGYGLIKCISKLKPIVELSRDIGEEVTARIKKDHPVDEVRYNDDPAYKKQMDRLYTSLTNADEKMQAFMKDSTNDVGYHTMVISKERLKEVDPNGLFNVALIPFVLIDTVFIIE